MRSTLIYVFIALILVTLGGCLMSDADIPERIVEPSSIPPVSGAIPPEVGLTPKQRNIKALGLLGEGKAQEARVELKASLAELPADRNSLAKNLISQIDGKPVNMLGSKYFKHEIAKGETLSLIAEQYLGDKFKFYVLARYNDVENPSLVAEGDVIKVPGLKPITPPDPPIAEGPTPPIAETPTPPIAESPTPPTAETPTPPIAESPTPPENGLVEITDLLSEAGDMADAGNYSGAIDLLENGLKRFPDEKMVKVYLADGYVKHGEALSEQHKYGEARSALQRAAALDPENEDISGRLAEADRAAKADDLYREGQKYGDGNAVIDAYESYLAALKVWPDHDRAQVELASIKPQVAGIYYREGRTAFQRHDLKEALGMYDKTLEIDPNHEPAKLDRQRTIELLDKIDKIKDVNAVGEQDGAGQDPVSN